MIISVRVLLHNGDIVCVVAQKKKFDLKNVVVFIAMFPLIVVCFSIFEKTILLYEMKKVCVVTQILASYLSSWWFEINCLLCVILHQQFYFLKLEKVLER